MTDENEQDTEKEVATPEEGDDSDTEAHDDADSEDGDSDDLDESDESGEKETKGDDQEIDWKARANETEARLEREANRARDAEAFAASLMTTTQKIDFHAQSALSRLEQVTKQAEFKIWDANDRADYATKAINHPIMSKYADEVEKRVAACQKSGQAYTRENIAIRIAGEKAMAATSKSAGKKQKRAASENVDRSKSAATKGIGDKRVNGKLDPNSREAVRARLRNATF